MKLLSPGQSNTKMRKSGGRGALLFGLSLRPADGSGHNVCVFSTAGCRETCVLQFAGRSSSPGVKSARDRKTKWFFSDRAAFLAQLDADLASAERLAARQGLTPVVRLNVASDLAWEVYGVTDRHPNIRFYDYSKWTKGRRKKGNYSLTYSLNEDTPDGYAGRLLDDGQNVAVVFDTIYNPAHGRVDPLPTVYRLDGRRYRVIDGDIHDIRLPEFDGSGVIVGLRAKGGRAKAFLGVQEGFIRRVIGGVCDGVTETDLRKWRNAGKIDAPTPTLTLTVNGKAA